MPVSVKKQGPRFRLVEPTGRIAKNRAGTSIDGGGHLTRDKAIKQAQAVNISLNKRKKK